MWAPSFECSHFWVVGLYNQHSSMTSNFQSTCAVLQSPAEQERCTARHLPQGVVTMWRSAAFPSSLCRNPRLNRSYWKPESQHFPACEVRVWRIWLAGSNGFHLRKNPLCAEPPLSFLRPDSQSQVALAMCHPWLWPLFNQLPIHKDFLWAGSWTTVVLACYHLVPVLWTPQWSHTLHSVPRRHRFPGLSLGYQYQRWGIDVPLHYQHTWRYRNAQVCWRTYVWISQATLGSQPLASCFHRAIHPTVMCYCTSSDSSMWYPPKMPTWLGAEVKGWKVQIGDNGIPFLSWKINWHHCQFWLPADVVCTVLGSQGWKGGVFHLLKLKWTASHLWVLQLCSQSLLKSRKDSLSYLPGSETVPPS
jgi:hypothetical protein